MVSKEQLLSQDRTKTFNHLKFNKYILLDPYVCDIPGFAIYLPTLRKDVFKFKSKPYREAKEVMKRIKKKYVRSKNDNTIFISVHMRLTDMHYHLHKTYNLSMTPPRYFSKV